MSIISRKNILTTFGSLFAAMLLYGIFSNSDDRYQISQGLSSYNVYTESNKKS